jgi:apolipoprotein N-acyltransferase
MVRMRAIENHRWLLRATNTGVTAAIDPEGRVTQSMPRHVRGSLLASFGYNTYETFYTRHGDWLAWICAALTALLLLVGIARSRRRPDAVNAPAQ